MAVKKKTSKRKLVDWESVHGLYRLGHLSLRAISEQYEADHVNSQTFKKTVSNPAILKKATEEKWKKNLADKVQAKAKEDLVSEIVSSANQKTDDEIVNEAAGAIVNVVMLHRKEIKDLLQYEAALLKQLHNDSTKKGKKAVSTKEQSITLKNIASVRAQRIALERQAHNISDDGVSDEKKVIRVRAMEIGD